MASAKDLFTYPGLPTKSLQEYLKRRRMGVSGEGNTGSGISPPPNHDFLSDKVFLEEMLKRTPAPVQMTGLLAGSLVSTRTPGILEMVTWEDDDKQD